MITLVFNFPTVLTLFIDFVWKIEDKSQNGGFLIGPPIIYKLYSKAGMPLPKGWPCKGPMLDLAVDLAQRLLPAFNTTTGMPYGSVNLRYGVNKGETPVTCTAGVGTFIVEFGALSRLTGDQRFENAALRALEVREKI